MKKIILALCFILCIGIVPFVGACSSKSKLVSVYSVDFYDSVISLAVGETTNLQYKVFPANATDKSVEFSSFDPSVASVDSNGTVTLLKDQSTDILVRTKDGGYSAICTISPLVPPESIALDKTQIEQKYIDGSVNEVFVLSVGQTKILPITVEPFNSSIDKLQITSSNSIVEVVKGADWMIYGAKYGRSKVSVKYNNVELQFNVLVENCVEDVQLKQLNTSTNILQKNNEIYYGNKSLSLNNEEYMLVLNLKYKNIINSNQINLQTYVSDSSIFDVTTINDFSEYCDYFGVDISSSSDKLEPFNFLKYIKIKPKADGVARLFILTDAFDQNGLPIRIEVLISISASVGNIEAEIVSDHRIGGEETCEKLVYVDEVFGINVEKFANLHGEKYKVLTPRRTLFKIVEGADFVEPVGKIQNGYYSGEFFSCKSSSGNSKVVIEVLVEKEPNSESYLSTNVEFYVADRISSMLVEYNSDKIDSSEKSNLYIADEDEIVVIAKANDKLSYSGSSAKFRIGIVKTDGTMVDLDKLGFIFEITSSNEYVIGVDKTNKEFIVLSGGRSEILVRINDGEQIFEKTFYINVLINS